DGPGGGIAVDHQHRAVLLAPDRGADVGERCDLHAARMGKHDATPARDGRRGARPVLTGYPAGLGRDFRAAATTHCRGADILPRGRHLAAGRRYLNFRWRVRTLTPRIRAAARLSPFVSSSTRSTY